MMVPPPPSPVQRRSPAGVARWVLPWMFSTASHLCMVLALAFLTPVNAGSGSDPNGAIELTLVSLQSAEDIDAAEQAESGGEVQFASAEQAANAAEAQPSPTEATPESDPLQVESTEPLAEPIRESDLVQREPTTEQPAELPAATDTASQYERAENRASSSAAAHNEPRLALVPRTAPGMRIAPGVAPSANRFQGIERALARGAAQTQIFGTHGNGHKFVYVFDRSGSMDGHGGVPMMAAKREMISSVRQLGPTHQFQIIFYNQEPRVFDLTGGHGRLAFGTDQNKVLAERFIGGITSDGATQHEEPLSLALRMAPDVIFFLTDGDEPALSARQMDRLARLNRGTVINTIQFGYGPHDGDENFLVRLARSTGGEYAYVDVGDLAAYMAGRE